MSHGEWWVNCDDPRIVMRQWWWVTKFDKSSIVMSHEQWWGNSDESRMAMSQWLWDSSLLLVIHRHSWQAEWSGVWRSRVEHVLEHVPCDMRHDVCIAVGRVCSWRLMTSARDSSTQFTSNSWTHFLTHHWRLITSARDSSTHFTRIPSWVKHILWLT